MNFIEPKVADYLRKLCDRSDEQVLLEMEEKASAEGFPIVGRVVGAMLEMLSRSIGAKRVFEMGSGFGFSAYWFARGVGESGKVTLTDGDVSNEEQAEDYLTRAGLWERCEFIVGDALKSLREAPGEFDIVYCDVDKTSYPEALKIGKAKVRVGGYWICDNVLWSGKVATDEPDPLSQAIIAHNRDLYSDPSFLPTIVPIRDGVICALRLK